MPDLIIGGNTYKNVDFVKVKKTDGKTAVFYNSERQDQRQPSARFASCLSGKPMIYISATVKSAVANAKMTREI